MKTNKLFTLLKIFSEKEMKDFEKFLVSPYFNKGRNFKPFYNILKNYYPDFESPDLTEENIFKKLYPGKEYNKKSSLSVRVIESQLTRMAEKFLGIEEFTSSKEFTRNSFIKILERKCKDDLIISYSKKFLEEDKKCKITQDFFLSQYLVREKIASIMVESNSRDWEFSKKSIEESVEFLILHFVRSLISYYRNNKMFSSKYLPESKMLQDLESVFDLEKFMSLLENNKLINTDLISSVYYSYKIIDDMNDFESYKKLKDLIFKLKDRLSDHYKLNMYISLLNFCMYQDQRDRIYFLSEYIDIYLELLKDAKGEIAKYLFNIRAIRNVIKHMSETGRSSEIAEYLKKHSDNFSPEIREECINYAHATLHFVNEEYNNCLERISKHNFKIPMMIKDMKMMKMQCCYMMEYFDLLYNEIDSYRHFLASTKGIPQEFINNDKKVLKYFHRLASITEKKSKKELEYYNEELIKLNSSNSYINWMTAKIKKILNTSVYFGVYSCGENYNLAGWAENLCRFIQV